MLFCCLSVSAHCAVDYANYNSKMLTYYTVGADEEENEDFIQALNY